MSAMLVSNSVRHKTSTISLMQFLATEFQSPLFASGSKLDGYVDFNQVKALCPDKGIELQPQVPLSQLLEENLV